MNPDEFLRRERLDSDMAISDAGPSSGPAASAASEAALASEAAVWAQVAEAAQAAAEAAAAEAREEQCRLENRALETERQRVEAEQQREELMHKAESQAQIMGELDVQNQALEKRAREAEARARVLAEEMQQLLQTRQGMSEAGKEDPRAAATDANAAQPAIAFASSEVLPQPPLADVADDGSPVNLADLEDVW